MRLTRLYKDDKSGASGCPTVYLAESGELVIQGRRLDAATTAELENVLPGETAVRIAPEVVLGAVRQYTSASKHDSAPPQPRAGD